jgi:hypothetical protein
MLDLEALRREVGEGRTRPSHGLYYLLGRRGAVERRFTEAEVTQAKSEPPPDTRARIRGQFIKLAREKSIAYGLDWSTIRIENPLNLRLVCSNPFETDVEEMIDFVRTSQEVNLRKARLSELSSPARHRSAAVR